MHCAHVPYDGNSTHSTIGYVGYPIFVAKALLLPSDLAVNVFVRGDARLNTGCRVSCLVQQVSVIRRERQTSNGSRCYVSLQRYVG